MYIYNKSEYNNDNGEVEATNVATEQIKKNDYTNKKTKTGQARKTMVLISNAIMRSIATLPNLGINRNIIRL